MTCESLKIKRFTPVIHGNMDETGGQYVCEQVRHIKTKSACFYFYVIQKWTGLVWLLEPGKSVCQ